MKIYELIYQHGNHDCYYQIALSFDKNKLQDLIDKAQEFDEFWQEELKKLETLDDYEIDWKTPSYFPLLGQEWFDEDEFFSDEYDGDCAKNFEIKERDVI